MSSIVKHKRTLERTGGASTEKVDPEQKSQPDQLASEKATTLEEKLPPDSLPAPPPPANQRLTVRPSGIPKSPQPIKKKRKPVKWIKLH